MEVKFTLIGLLLMMHLTVLGQHKLTGTISAEGQQVPRATVSLNKQFNTISDSAGFFSFASVPPGKYLLHVTMTGFEPFKQNIAIDDSATKSIQINLQPSTSSLDAIVISGTMKAVRRLESPIAVEVYSQQFFKKNPSPSLFESLSMVNGVRPQINCNVCNTGDIHINGLEGPYTMVTIDGMPIVSSLSSVYGLFGIPNQMIERVEVVKGPASGLYGSEAIGGLINIITKSPQKVPLFSANVMSTSWREHLVDLGAKWKLGSLNSILGVNYFNYSNPIDRNGDNFTDLTLQHRVSVFNKWSLSRPMNRMASLAGRYFYEDRWGGEMNWNKQHRGGDEVYGESIYTKRWELIGNYQLPTFEKIMLAFSATGHHQDSYYGTAPYLANQRIIFGQATWDKNFGSQSFLLGLAGRYNYYDDNSTATIDTTSKTNRPEKVFLPGIFLQNEWQVNNAHKLLFGLRIDHHPIHKQIFTPRLAYKWTIDENKIFRMNAGTGFRVVNLFTEEHASLTGARAVEVKDQLQPEKSYNVNVNYNHKLGSRSKAAAVDVSAWYTYFNNQIIPDYDTDPMKIIYANLSGYSVSKGVSVNLETNFWQRLKSNIGFTLQDVAKYDRDADDKVIKQRPVLTESLSGNWALSYSFPLAGLTIDYTGNIYGPMRLPLVSKFDPRSPTSPVWSIQNIQLTKWFSSQFEIYGGVKNLLNWTPARNNPFLIARAHDPFDKQLDYDGDGKTDVDVNGDVLRTNINPYGLTFDPSYVFAPNQGIRFFLGLRLHMKN